MANAFNVTMQLQIQGPNNLRPVVSALQNQIKNVKGTINFQVSPTTNRNVAALSSNLNALNVSLKLNQGAAAATSTAIQGVATNVAKASAGVSSFGQNIGLATRRFLAFQIGAVLAVSKVTDAIRDGVNEALLFQKTLVNLSQVGTSAKGITEIADSITSLSKNLGVSSKGLAEVSVTLKQAGLSASEVTTALEALAKTSLAPTFRDINKTTEGLIAMRQQFGLGAKDFERTLGAINTVSAAFAVESEDLVEAIRRSGAAFKAASSDMQGSEQTFNQFISLVSSVRSTTRESASEIGTGLRTIFARLQSGRVAENLKALGVNLRFTGEEAALAGKQIEGQFVGAWEAVARLSQVLKDVPTTDPRFAAIVEQVGGFRQISRVIPLIQQFGQAQKAYSIAQGGANSLTLDAGKAQGIFLVQLTKVREEFMDLVRTLGNNKTLQAFGAFSLDLASSLIKLTKALEPLVPLLTLFAAVKLGGTLKSVASNIGTFAGNVGRGLQGHAAVRRATGGPVPGSGFGDKVPAMLEPGEFVVNRKSATAIGYNRLNEWNRTGVARMARGGRVTGSLAQIAAAMFPEVKNKRKRFAALQSEMGMGKLAASSKLGGKDDEAIYNRLVEVANAKGFDLSAVTPAATGRAGSKVRKAKVAKVAEIANTSGSVGDYVRDINEANSGSRLNQIQKEASKVFGSIPGGADSLQQVQVAAQERRKVVTEMVKAEIQALGKKVNQKTLARADRIDPGTYQTAMLDKNQQIGYGGQSFVQSSAHDEFVFKEEQARKQRLASAPVSLEDVAPPPKVGTTHQIGGHVSGRESKRQYITGDVGAAVPLSTGLGGRFRKASPPAPPVFNTPTAPLPPPEPPDFARILGLVRGVSDQKGSLLGSVAGQIRGGSGNVAAQVQALASRPVETVLKEILKTDKESVKEVKKTSRTPASKLSKDVKSAIADAYRGPHSRVLDQVRALGALPTRAPFDSSTSIPRRGAGDGSSIPFGRLTPTVRTRGSKLSKDEKFDIMLRNRPKRVGAPLVPPDLGGYVPDLPAGVPWLYDVGQPGTARRGDPSFFQGMVRPPGGDTIPVNVNRNPDARQRMFGNRIPRGRTGATYDVAQTFEERFADIQEEHERNLRNRRTSSHFFSVPGTYQFEAEANVRRQARKPVRGGPADYDATSYTHHENLYNFFREEGRNELLKNVKKSARGGVDIGDEAEDMLRSAAANRAQEAIDNREAVYLNRQGGVRSVGQSPTRRAFGRIGAVLNRPLGGARISPAGQFDAFSAFRPQDAVAAPQTRLGRLGGFAGRVGSGIAANGLLAAAFVPGLLESGFGTVDAPTGTRNAARLAQGASGGVVGAALGGQAGFLAGGPMGAAIGAVSGGLIGLYRSLKEAQNRIDEIDFENSFKPFQSFLNDVANGRTKLDDTSRGRITGGLDIAEREARRRVAVAGNGGTYLDRANDFLGTGSFGNTTRAATASLASGAGLGLINRIPQALGFEKTITGNFTSTTRERKAEQARQAAEERTKILTPELPALQQIGEQIARGLKLSSSDVSIGAGASADDIAASRRGRIDAFNRAGGEQIAQTISEINKLPIAQVYDQFDQLIISSNRLRHGQETAAAAADLMTIQMHKFGHLTEAFGAASASVRTLEDSAERISALFEGNVATASSGGFSAGAGQIGGIDRTAFQRSLQFTQSNIGGPVSSEFGRVVSQIDKTQRDLPGLLAGTAFDFTNSDAMQTQITKLLTDSLGLDKSVANPISAGFAGMEPEKLLRGLQTNPQKLVDDLIEEAFGKIKDLFGQQAKELEDNFNKFANGLTAYSQKVLRAGDTLDRVSVLRLGAQRATAELQGVREGRSPGSFLSLDTLRAPFNARQARLAGGAAGDPEAIGRQLQAAQLRQTAAQERLDSPQLRGVGENERAARRELHEEFNAASLDAAKLSQALQHLADSSEESAAIQEKLNDIEKIRSGQLSFTEKLLTADPKELFQIQRASALSDTAVGQGNFQGFLPNQIREVLDYLSSLQDVRLPGYGNRTGGDVAGGLLNPSNRAIFGKTATNLEQGRDDLLREQVSVAERTVKAQEVLAQTQETLAKGFLDKLQETNTKFFSKLDEFIAQSRVNDLRAAERNSEAAKNKVQSQVNAIGSIEALPGIGGGNFEKVKQILNAPEFSAFRAAGQQKATLAQTNQQLFGKGQLAAEAAKPVFLGQRFAQVGQRDFGDEVDNKIESQLQAATGEIIKRTGFNRSTVEQEIIPDVLGKLSDYRAKPEFSRGSFDIQQEIVKSIQASLGKAQIAASDDFNLSRGALTKGILGSEPADAGGFEKLLDNVARNQPLIAGKIGNGLNEVGSPADLLATLKALTEATEKLTQQREEAEAKATYKAAGGIAFTPRGTDTVPAMLSPGEYVVNASATRANLSLLQSINSARGPIYRAAGGYIQTEEERKKMLAELEAESLGKVDSVFASDSRSAGDLKKLVSQGQEALKNQFIKPNDAGNRRLLALQRLQKEASGFQDTDQLNASASGLYNRLLSADSFATESTQLSSNYSPLTAIDRVASAVTDKLGITSGLSNFVPRPSPSIAMSNTLDADSAVEELGIRKEQQRRRRLSDPEKQALNINEMPLGLGLDPKFRATQLSAPLFASDKAGLASIEPGLANLQKSVSAAQAESAAFAASPAAAQAASAKGQVDALRGSQADRTRQLQVETAQRRAQNEAADQARAAVAAKTAAARQRRLSPVAAEVAPVENPALAGLPASLANNNKISDEVKQRIVAQQRAKQTQQAANAAVIPDFDKKRALRQQTFNADLLRAGVEPAEARPRRAQLPSIRKSRDAYYNNIASATKEANKKGGGFSQRQLFNAAKARNRLQSEMQSMKGKDNLPKGLEERTGNLFYELKASKIGSAVDSADVRRAQKGFAPLGSTAAQQKAFAKAYRERKRQEASAARRGRTAKGPITFAEGGLVPAMVSPGEFIVNGASAKANAPLLNSINSGRSPVYRQSGGSVGGSGGGVSLGGDMKGVFDTFVKSFQGAVDSLGEPIQQLRGVSEVFGRVGGSFDTLATSMTKLSDMLNPFNDAASSLAKALSNVNIPSKIEVATRGDFTVTLNGAALIAAMKGDMATEVLKQVQAQLEGQVRKAIESMPPRS